MAKKQKKSKFKPEFKSWQNLGYEKKPLKFDTDFRNDFFLFIDLNF